MGRYERNKGIRAEREVVRILKKAGINARRVPLSGAAPYYKGDVVIELDNAILVAEVKIRKKGHSDIYRWLEEGAGELLIHRVNRKPFLVTMPLKTFAEFLKRRENDESHEA